MANCFCDWLSSVGLRCFVRLRVAERLGIVADVGLSERVSEVGCASDEGRENNETTNKHLLRVMATHSLARSLSPHPWRCSCCFIALVLALGSAYWII
jgi:hypothetical protein